MVRNAVAIALCLWGVSLSAWPVPRDPCAEQRWITDAQCEDELTCTGLERAALACQVREAMRRNYSLWHLKPAMLPAVDGARFDSLEHMNGCVRAEQENRSNDVLAFFDRMRRCLAGFRDSHLGGETQVALPHVYTGIGIREISGRYYIAERDPEIVRYLQRQGTSTALLPSLSDALAVGNEVTEIDGHPPIYWKNRLKPFISASSEPYAEAEAVRAIFQRNFSYPTRGSTVIRVASVARPIEIPWWAGAASDAHPAARALFRRLRIADSERVAFTYDSFRNQWVKLTLQTEGYLDSNPILPTHQRRALDVYQDAGRKREVLRLGRGTLQGGRTFCYVELNDFQNPILVAKEDTANASHALIATIRTFLRDCKTDELPTVLDLRSNPGGHLDLPEQLFSLFLKKNEPKPGKAIAFRADTRFSLLLAAAATPSNGAVARYLGQHVFSDLAEIERVIRQARSNAMTHTEILVNPTVEPDGEVDGYEGNVAVLIGPACVSACDLTAALFKRSRRGTLIGTATNGTGAGHINAAGLLSTWRDTGSLFRINIPNFLFGVLDRAARETSLPFAENQGAVLMENRPTVPDRAYTETLDDIKGRTFGWMQAVGAVLFP